MLDTSVRDVCHKCGQSRGTHDDGLCEATRRSMLLPARAPSEPEADRREFRRLNERDFNKDVPPTIYGETIMFVIVLLLSLVCGFTGVYLLNWIEHFFR